MNWVKVILSLVVILLYIPLVFMSANVLFPDYTGSESYYNYKADCNSPRLEGDFSFNETCFNEQEQERLAFEEAKNTYNGSKYAFIVLINLVVLILALLLTLEESIIIGLFLGSVLTTFFATWTYFQTRSIPGLIALASTFVIALVFISRKKDIFLKKKKVSFK